MLTNPQYCLLSHLPVIEPAQSCLPGLQLSDLRHKAAVPVYSLTTKWQ